ncbi:hypothetical protein F4824DRAFT_506556 [Ustulina deusta]|nr:hypothetical protein F4824DRAFT_506556 [Ustulina deusta]
MPFGVVQSKENPHISHLCIVDSARCSGLTWKTGYCYSTITEGEITYTNLPNCWGSGTISFGTETTVSVLARPILLLAEQKFPTTTPLTFTKSSSATSPSSSIHSPDFKHLPMNEPTLSETAKIGITLGSILGGISLLSFAFFCIRRRKKRGEIARKEEQAEQAAKVEPSDYIGKPELAGSEAYVYTAKAELDAAATRAELEGSLVESRGDGIRVVKAELEGSIGTERNRGENVRKKPELEAVSKPGTSTAHQNLTDLEAVLKKHASTAEQSIAEFEAASPSARDGADVVAGSEHRSG